MNDRRAFITKKDLWLLGGVIVLAAIIYIVYLFFGSRFDGVKAQIVYDGVVVKEFVLNRDGRFTIEAKPHVHFEVKDGAVAFVESDCPDRVCIAEGFINKPGQIAACLPNEMLLQIVGTDATPTDGDEWEMDAVAQ